MAKHEKTRCVIWSSILIGLSINVVSSNPLLFQQQQQQQTPMLGPVPCDSQSSCGANQTCCRMPSGKWGCCPLPKAVCCSDGQSCCPKGFTCDVPVGKCVHNNQQFVTDMVLKQKAYNPFDTSEHVLLPTADVRCNDTQSCERQQTCCKKTNGDWGCCPYPKAVCCSNDKCCNHGLTCDVANDSCKKHRDDGEATTITSLSLSADTKVLGDDQSQQSVSLTVSVQLTVAVGEHTVQCDQQWYCSDGQTCCMLASGQWGCCPLPQAVCCSDHSTCCPSGYLCVPGGKCVHAESRFLPDASYWNVVPSVERAPAMYRPVSGAEDGNREAQDTRMMATSGVVDDVVCPDLNRCSSKSSCCQLSSGLYACCPYHDGVCCETHCCPAGTSCDLENNSCVSYSSWASLAP